MKDLEILIDLDNQLKGQTHTKSGTGELVVRGFETEEEYEELYFYLLEKLKDFFDGDYYNWYTEQCRRYARFRRSNSARYDKVIPQESLRVEEHTIRQQLAVIRWYIYKRANSARYFKGGKFNKNG